MNFYSIDDLQSAPSTVWEILSSDGEVVITANEKPSALLIDIPDGNFKELLQTIQQAKAIIALNNMRRKAEEAGFLSDDEIESIIAEIRSEA